jgi:hypothetical protein
MALIFGTNTKILFSGALLKVLGNVTSVQGGGPYTIGTTIYSGTAPTTDQVVASWATYNSSAANYLVHLTNSQWNQPAFGSLISISTVPTAVVPARAGTATWAIMWAGQPTPAQLSGAVLPFAAFLIVGVTDPAGDGVIRVVSTAFNTSTAVTIQDGTFASFI